MLRALVPALKALIAPLVMAGVLTGIPGSSASASTCASWTGTQPPSPGSAYDVFTGVAVLSSCNAWAVGSYSNSTNNQDQTLIEHWNGSSWKQVASPNPGGSSQNDLYAVTAISASNIWAVGSYVNVTAGESESLVLHWNGSSWKQVPSPNVGLTGELLDYLTAVRGSSATNIWAVGWYERYEGGPLRTLAEHWNGTVWKLVATPSPDSDKNFLNGVATISGSNAWAVGSYGGTGSPGRSLVLHWNGTAWKQVASPNPDSLDTLNAVAAVSSANIWAAGAYYNGTAFQTLIEHWNGTAWKRVSSPNPGGTTNFLLGVAAVSSTNLWAVGYNGPAAGQTLVLHWNGTAWKHVTSPNLTPPNFLSAVAASSATNVWAVGYYGEPRQPLAIHCC